MKYRNIKTGAIIDAYGTIKGKDWEAVPSGPAPDKNEEVAPAQPKRKARGKKSE